MKSYFWKFYNEMINDVECAFAMILCVFVVVLFYTDFSFKIYF